MIRRIKRVVLITLCAGFIPLVAAQNYVDIIREIAEKSLENRAYKALFTVDSLAQRLGLNPEDPEVEMTYNFRNHNKELEFTQQFDFPTVYVQRGKLSRLGIQRAALMRDQSQRDLMLEISESYISEIYYSKLEHILESITDDLDDYVQRIGRGLKLGENIIIDLEGAKMLASEMFLELQMVKSEKQKSLNNLRKWGFIELLPEEYPTFRRLMREEFIETAKEVDISMEFARTDSLIAQRMLRLSRNEWIPKIKVGYKAEFEHRGSTYNSIIAGISIPLWGNRNNIKHSKALIESAKTQSSIAELNVINTLENLYTAFEFTERALSAQPDNFQLYAELLRKSLEKGGITYIEFLISICEKYSTQQKFMTLEMEHAKNQAMIEILTSY